MAIGDFEVRTIRWQGGHKAMLLRKTQHGDAEVLSGYATDPTMAMRELYRGLKRLLSLVEQAGTLSSKIGGGGK